MKLAIQSPKRSKPGADTPTAHRRIEAFKLPGEGDILENAPVGIFLSTVPGKLLAVNATGARMFGYASPDEFLAHGTDMAKRFFVLPEQRQELLRKVLDSWDFVRAEVSYRRKDGSSFVGHLHARAVWDQHGKPAFVEGFVEDITERKRVELALQESETRYRLLFQSAHDAIFVLRVDQVISCNPAAIAMFGCPEEEILGQTPLRFSPPVQPDGSDSREKATEIIGSTLAGVSSSFEWRHCKLDGTEFDAEVSLNRFELNGEYLLHAIVRDTTERKRAEAALQRSEARYRTLVERAPLPIGISRDAITVYVNPKYAELFRFQNAEAQVGRPIKEYWAPEWRDLIEARARRRSQGLPVPSTYEGVAQREDGSRFPVQVAATIAELPDGPATLAFMTDITELKQVEAELKRHQEHLEELVAVRTADLQAANGELEAFSYSVSHDLRAPLRTINGYAQILLRSHASSVPEASQNMLKEIMHQAQRMDQLIKDLLAFSRVGRQAMQSVLIDMDALAHEVFTEQSTAQPNTKAQIKFNPLPPAFGDRGMIRVVLNNLFSNALKYSRNRDPALIEVGGSTQEGQNVYFVKDNGAGFDMQYADQLFEVFQRLHDKDEFEGTGVGLAMVHRIIQRHGGRIWAEGKVDEGATFSFSLPARAANT